MVCGIFGIIFQSALLPDHESWSNSCLVMWKWIKLQSAKEIGADDTTLED